MPKPWGEEARRALPPQKYSYYSSGQNIFGLFLKKYAFIRRADESLPVFRTTNAYIHGCRIANSAGRSLAFNPT
jgi:hypothetical protein